MHMNAKSPIPIVFHHTLLFVRHYQQVSLSDHRMQKKKNLKSWGK